MKNKWKYIVSICIFLVLLVGICIIIYFNRRDEKMDVLLISDKREVLEDNNTDVLDTNEDNDAPSSEATSGDDLKDNTNEDNTISNNDTNDNTNTNTYTEEDVVSYFSEMENEVDSSSSFKEKFKDYFITIVDFIFYDTEIKGYTFDELSGTAKAKVISIALKIDSKIEEYIPGYKDTISSTGSRIYTNVKEKLVTLYMDISTDICRDNENGCNKVKEIFSDIKDTCSIGWDFIKGLASSGVSKLKEWYEIYSGK